ncbi:hypothetical protein [uncultured Phycicoccus sp.]|uniref:hypothetical protein n=1 Tax=uncultured Phycicoccus sp. TaxID=661422 RepID=UPI00262BE042|nr:hypothetical protein [uncultured Phycicoccus sp.]
MSTSSAFPAPAGPRHAADLPYRYARARRWAVGVLLAGTLAAFAYLAAVLAAVWLVASAYDALTAGSLARLDVVAAAADLAPGLLVGWCTGLAMVSVLARGEGIGPRTAGVAAGSVGVLAGVVVLRLTGVL